MKTFAAVLVSLSLLPVICIGFIAKVLFLALDIGWEKGDSILDIFDES